MQVLVTLAERPGEVVTREELLEAVWNGTFVVDEVLSNAIWELRRALGDDVKLPRYIQTVPKKGYRLIAPVDLPRARATRTTPWKGYAVSAVALLSIILWRLWPDLPVSTPEPVRITWLDGRERGPVLSPDGRRIAFFTEFELYVVSAEGGDPLLLSRTDGYFGSAAWSPDGEWIAFSRWGLHDRDVQIRRVRALGGSERLIATTHACENLDWSPNGSWLACTGKESDEDPGGIYLHAVDTGARQRLTSPPSQGLGDRKPKFSPDGNRVAFLRRDPALMEPSAALYEQELNGSSEARRITSAQARMDSFDWLPDGRGFVAAVRDRLVYVPRDTGELIPLDVVEGVRDVSTEGERLVYRAGTVDRDIWRFPGPMAESGAEPAPWVTSRSQELMPQYSPDGSRVLFGSERSGAWEVWVCDAEASNKNCRQLTFFGESVGAAAWSPDGRHMVILGGFRTPMPGLYLMSADGGVPERLTPEDQPTGHPSWSPDGGTLYFNVGLDDSPELWRLSLSSRQSSPIGDLRGIRPIASDDGRFLYYSKSWGAHPIARVPLAGGHEEIALDKRPGHYEWDLWQNHLVYLLWELPYTIEALDLETRETRTVATLPADYTPHMGFSVSPDGRWILLTKNEDEWDVMLLENYLSAIPR